jgi:hypothetical protein
MARIDLDLDEMLDGFTRDGMKKFVKRLLAAGEAEEREMLDKLDKRAATPEKESNDLADLKEEKSGKPSPIDVDAEPTRRKRDG